MAVDFSSQLYAICQSEFGRTVTITPNVSQPSGAAYVNRGIFDTRELNVVMDDGSILADQETILDILAADYPIFPQQGDLVQVDDIYLSGELAQGGSFIVVKATHNGGGEITLVLKSTQVGS
jgi:hypothetical protein